eukprot:g11975.t1
MGGVRECHRELIDHGAAVVLNKLVTANKPFAPSTAHSARTPMDALKQDTSSPPPPSSPPPESPSSKRLRVCPEPSTYCSSSSSPPSAVSQPAVVALHLFTRQPRDSSHPLLFTPLKVSGVSEGEFSFLHVHGMQHVAGMKVDERDDHTSVVDLVIWHRSDHVLELQADTSFTTASVTNAIAREIALGSARALLLEAAEQSFSRGESAGEEEDHGDYAPKGARDPVVVEFVARFTANLIALVEEASSAPATFCVSHSLLPQDVKERLREKISLNRQRRADMEEYQRLKKDYDGAMKTFNSKAAGASTPAAARDTPKKPKYPSEDIPTSPDPLAASPPTVVLRPIDDLYRVFTEAEILVVFKKVILSRDDCILCPGFMLWFEKKNATRNELGAVRHEYGCKTGDPYC